MTNKKTLFKNLSIFLCLVPMFLLSLFCLIPDKQNFDISAAAINNFNFRSANYTSVSTSFVNHSTVNAWHFTTYSISINYNGGVYSVGVDGYTIGRGTATNNFGSVYAISGTCIPSYNENVNLSGVFTGVTTHSVDYLVYLSGNFNGNIYKMIMDSAYNDNNSSVVGHLENRITFYDSDNNFIRVSILSKISGSYNSESDILKYRWDYRDYYFNINVSDNTYYENGYNVGYDEGYNAGNDSGYNSGYGSGYDNGYNVGYNDGVNYGTDYSFSSLFGAVIDTPVNAFTSLLNFEIFGVNILGLITGLLSIALIVFVVKLCTGGK